MHPYQSASRTIIPQISTKEIVEWQVSAQIVSFDSIPKIVLMLTLPPDADSDRSEPYQSIKSFPFILKPIDLLIPDSSCLNHLRDETQGIQGNLKF